MLIRFRKGLRRLLERVQWKFFLIITFAQRCVCQTAMRSRLTLASRRSGPAVMRMRSRGSQEGGFSCLQSSLTCAVNLREASRVRPAGLDRQAVRLLRACEPNGSDSKLSRTRVGLHRPVLQARRSGRRSCGSVPRRDPIG